MNVELLRKIAAVIQEKPAEFDMRWLHTRGDRAVHDGQGYFDCGTAHCICGWGAAIENNPDIQNNVIGHEAFGIDANQGWRLFFVGSWPKTFQARYLKAVRQSTKARIAAARIEHFIATDGAE